MKSRPSLLATIAFVATLLLASAAQANIDVTLDISRASDGPAISQGAPQTPADTGFDPLPLGGLAMLLIALGSLGLVTRNRTDRQGEGTS